MYVGWMTKCRDVRYCMRLCGPFVWGEWPNVGVWVVTKRGCGVHVLGGEWWNVGVWQHDHILSKQKNNYFDQHPCASQGSPFTMHSPTVSNQNQFFRSKTKSLKAKPKGLKPNTRSLKAKAKVLKQKILRFARGGAARGGGVPKIDDIYGVVF